MVSKLMVYLKISVNFGDTKPPGVCLLNLQKENVFIFTFVLTFGCFLKIHVLLFCLVFHFFY